MFYFLYFSLAKSKAEAERRPKLTRTIIEQVETEDEDDDERSVAMESVAGIILNFDGIAIDLVPLLGPSGLQSRNDDHSGDNLKGVMWSKLFSKKLKRGGEYHCFNCPKQYSTKGGLLKHLNGSGETNIPCKERIALWEVLKIIRVRHDKERDQVLCLCQYKPTIMNVKCISFPLDLLVKHGNRELLDYWKRYEKMMKARHESSRTKKSNSRGDRSRQSARIAELAENSDTENDDDGDDDGAVLVSEDDTEDSDTESDSEADDNFELSVDDLRIRKLLKWIRHQLKIVDAKKLDLFHKILDSDLPEALKNRKLLLLTDKDSNDGHLISTRHVTNKSFGMECPNCGQSFADFNNQRRHVKDKVCTNGKKVVWESYQIAQILRSYYCVDEDEWYVVVDWCPSECYLRDIRCKRLLKNYETEIQKRRSSDGSVALQKLTNKDIHAWKTNPRSIPFFNDRYHVIQEKKLQFKKFSKAEFYHYTFDDCDGDSDGDSDSN